GGLALVWYRIEAFRYLASQVRLSAMQLHSNAKGTSAVGQMLLFGLGMIGIAIGLSLLFALLSAIAMPILQGVIVGKTVSPPALIVVGFLFLVPLYVLILWAMQLAVYCWLWIPIIKHLATTLDIGNFAAASEIAQSTQPRQKLGIADSFELGAF
ncbi:MAG TPA: hypothetical protein VHY80_21245, partial [Stellaceae bacterium]|nr:hypothetical protein [Stellaceae bacterium]